MFRKKKRKLAHEPYWEFKGYLAKNNIKLKELADLLGCTISNISMKNNGHAEYSMTEIDAICTHLGISSEIFRSKKSAG